MAHFRVEMGESVETNNQRGGHTMAMPEPLNSVKDEAAKDKSSKPKVAGNLRKLARAGTSVWQAESEDAQMSAGNLGTMLLEVSKVSMDEIDHLIAELQTLRGKLQTDCDRIERDIMEYATLSEQATQLTKIVFEGVKQLPTRA
jgi:hypothetical protein